MKSIITYIKEAEEIHMAQAKCYAYIYAVQNDLREIQVRISYCNIETEEMPFDALSNVADSGFATVIKPEFNNPETVTFCKDCHKCADLCPTGALKILN